MLQTVLQISDIPGLCLLTHEGAENGANLILNIAEESRGQERLEWLEIGGDNQLHAEFLEYVKGCHHVFNICPSVLKISFCSHLCLP